MGENKYMLANVYDLKNIDITKIPEHTKFAIDTNVLYWMHYSRCNTTGYQIMHYPQFISDLMERHAVFVTTACNVSELLHLVEKKEYDIFKVTNRTISIKDFRKVRKERENVKQELETIIMQIESMYSIHDFELDFSLISKFVHDFDNHRCDNNDYSILTYLKNAGITNIISDDSDFITYAGMNVYTANNNIINEAITNDVLCVV